MKFTTSILTIFAASVLLLQSCGSDTTTNSTELANVLDAAADREGVPSGECRDKCVAAALAMFDACTDDGGNREACFGHALLSFFDCAKQCGDPEPPACEDKCEEYAHKVYEQCLKDNVEPKNSGTGGEEERCAALAREAYAECLEEVCVDPDPTPIGCDEGRCLDASQASLCKDAVAACIAFEPLVEEECILAANFLFCEEGEPDPEPGEPPASGEVCDEGLCAEAGDARDGCEDALALCVAENPDENWDECVIGVQLIYCEVL